MDPTEPTPDTIAAIATPPGRGGIGILRLSGPQALPIAQSLLSKPTQTPLPRRPRLCSLIEPATGQKLDEALVTYFPAPRSYTGEDVVEIAAHGSPVLLAHLLSLLLAQGASLAEPGEFTERAFLSGRLDLTQAEAVRDLIDAQTLLQAQTAASQLGGAVARRLAPVKQAIIALIAQLEAGIDFAEDDTPVLPDEAILAHLQAPEQALAELERSFKQGQLVMQGVRLAIVGRPNVGKSSLFNRLLNQDRAIVTPEPGTTRDTVRETLSLGGIPIELIDTAGMREAANEAEKKGIARSHEALADAGIVLLVLDCTHPLNKEEQSLLAVAAQRPLLIALNKSDLLNRPRLPHMTANQPSATTERAVAQPSATQALQSLAPHAAIILTSATKGDGIAELQKAMRSLLGGTHSAPPDSAMLTNLRQHTAVAAALAAVEAAKNAAEQRLPHELLLLDLHTALQNLSQLTGATTPDDILSLIFSTFCIGK